MIIYEKEKLFYVLKKFKVEKEISDLGIISPYRNQAKVMVDQLDDTTPISTVHKFQGCESNDIIITTVDNEITEFANT